MSSAKAPEKPEDLGLSMEGNTSYPKKIRVPWISLIWAVLMKGIVDWPYLSEYVYHFANIK